MPGSFEKSLSSPHFVLEQFTLTAVAVKTMTQSALLSSSVIVPDNILTILKLEDMVCYRRGHSGGQSQKGKPKDLHGRAESEAKIMHEGNLNQ